MELRREQVRIFRTYRRAREFDLTERKFDLAVRALQQIGFVVCSVAAVLVGLLGHYPVSLGLSAAALALFRLANLRSKTSRTNGHDPPLVSVPTPDEVASLPPPLGSPQADSQLPALTIVAPETSSDLPSNGGAVS